MNYHQFDNYFHNNFDIHMLNNNKLHMNQLFYYNMNLFLDLLDHINLKILFLHFHHNLLYLFYLLLVHYHNLLLLLQ